VFNGASEFESVESMEARIDEFVTPNVVQPLRRRLGPRDGHAVPVDEAGGVPLRRHAQRARSCVGGAASRRRASCAPQFCHVIDVAATVLDSVGVPEPSTVNGIHQMPLHGVSMRYMFDDAKAAERPRDAVLRDVLQPRDLPPGLDRGDAAQARRG